MSLESDIADLMRQSGRSRAESNYAAARIALEGRRERDAIRTNLWTNLGQLASQVPMQIVAAKQAASEADAMRMRQQMQAEELQLKQAERQRLAQGRQVLGEAIKRFTSADDRGIPQPDAEAIARTVTEAGFPDVAQSWLTMTSENASAIRKISEGRAAEQRKALEGIGDVAFSAKTPSDFVAGVGLLAAHGLIDEQTAHRVAAAADSDQWQEMRDRYMQFSPRWQASQKTDDETVVVPAGATLVKKGTGAELFKAPVKATDAPHVGSFEDYVTRYAAGKGKQVTDLTPADIEDAQKRYQQADDRPRITVNTGESADTEALVQAVIDNPALWDDLTPTVKGKIAPKLQAKGYRDFGKPMSSGALSQAQASMTALDSLKDLRQVVKENEQYIGPIAGLQALNPYSDARKAQAKVDMVRQRVGKALEGGVLRKEDEEKYKKILATLTDTPSTAVSKIDGLIKSVEQDIANFKAAQRLGGRRVLDDKPKDKKNPYR